MATGYYHCNYHLQGATIVTEGYHGNKPLHGLHWQWALIGDCHDKEPLQGL